jgi:hypothetical protein
VLKKAGIIAAAATAAVLALTPFAFAHESHPAPANHENVSSGNIGNDCAFDAAGPEVQSTATGGNSLVGAAGLVTDAIAPVTAQTQALNCTNINVSDLVDSNSNNDTRTANSTETRDSGNVTSD